MLKGKTALVTGGARGIGAAICKKLASMGADIAIVDLTVTEQAQALENSSASGQRHMHAMSPMQSSARQLSSR